MVTAFPTTVFGGKVGIFDLLKKSCAEFMSLFWKKVLKVVLFLKYLVAKNNKTTTTYLFKELKICVCRVEGTLKTTCVSEFNFSRLLTLHVCLQIWPQLSMLRVAGQLFFLKFPLKYF